MTETSLSRRDPFPPLLFTEGEGPWLVFWKDELVAEDTEWAELASHSCNGFRCDHLDGYVIPLTPETPAVAELLKEIALEAFCVGCAAPDLDYGVEPEHPTAFSRWLEDRGLAAGEISLLMQAVYPLQASEAVLLALGLPGVVIPPGAHLLVLGWNCD
ncbi:hypothetical protein [Pseudomonas sp. NPDC096950]|uniref:hypothetical protein n=1 Tax=Pseudomonas sp. NPDC096950 TaxID=3364485 RepID=UPI003839EBEF